MSCPAFVRALHAAEGPSRDEYRVSAAKRMGCLVRGSGFTLIGLLGLGLLRLWCRALCLWVHVPRSLSDYFPGLEIVLSS